MPGASNNSQKHLFQVLQNINTGDKINPKLTLGQGQQKQLCWGKREFVRFRSDQVPLHLHHNMLHNNGEEEIYQITQTTAAPTQKLNILSPLFSNQRVLTYPSRRDRDLILFIGIIVFDASSFHYI